MNITYYLKETPKGFTAVCDLFEMSIHKGLKANGRTKENAISNLNNKWNRKVDQHNKNKVLIKNTTVLTVQLSLTPIQ